MFIDMMIMAITLLNMFRKLVKFWQRFHFFAGWIRMISINIMLSQKYPMDNGHQFKFFIHCFSCVIQNNPSTVNVEYCSAFDHKDKLYVWCFMPAYFMKHNGAIWQIFRLAASYLIYIMHCQTINSFFQYQSFV